MLFYYHGSFNINYIILKNDKKNSETLSFKILREKIKEKNWIFKNILLYENNNN